MAIKKRVLVTGANSYIGTSFHNWVNMHYADALSVDTVDMIDGTWRGKDFSCYDAVFHVAGIAHADVGKVPEEEKETYYRVNRDLAVETAEKAKREGVRQFVFMSSAIVYGDSAPYGKKKRITIDTEPMPSNFYGDSKWQADKGVRSLACIDYAVTVVRPPMVYGRDSKGNYVTLSKMARRLPFFPDIKNERSVLYIDNLCEFLCQVMMRGERGVFFPQDEEYISTSQMVKMIADVCGHKIKVSKLLNGIIKVLAHTSGKFGRLVNKAFGNLSYEKTMSIYDFEYHVADLRMAIIRTEKR